MASPAVRNWLPLVAALTALVGVAGSSAARSGDGAPRFTAKGALMFPADYRGWTFLTSGHGMS